MPRLTFYTPFPELGTEDEYSTFLKTHFKRGQKIASPFGLPFKYDITAPAANWKSYKHHVDELNHFKVVHLKKFAQMLKAHNEKDSVIVDERYPIRKIEPEDTLFSNYEPSDILFIHCHGNIEVIGTGGFILTPDLLAANLKELRLPRENPPIIVIWACKSGTQGTIDEKSYAEKTREELKKLDYKNLAVIGIDAKIMISISAKKDPVTYIREEAADQKKIKTKPVKEKDAMVPFLSPEPEAKFKETTTTEHGMFTQLKTVQTVIAKPILTQKNLATEFKSAEERPKKKSKQNEASTSSSEGQQPLKTQRKRPLESSRGQNSPQPRKPLITTQLNTTRQQPRKQLKQNPPVRKPPGAGQPIDRFMTPQLNMRQNQKKQPKQNLPVRRSLRVSRPPDRYH